MCTQATRSASSSGLRAYAKRLGAQLLCVGVVLLTSCAESGADACWHAAVEQAEAELRLVAVYGEHDAQHEAGTAHDDGPRISARVDLIRAEANTRQAC